MTEERKRKGKIRRLAPLGRAGVATRHLMSGLVARAHRRVGLAPSLAEVAFWRMSGLLLKEIAVVMGVEYDTVKTYSKEIRFRLSARSWPDAELRIAHALTGDERETLKQIQV